MNLHLRQSLHPTTTRAAEGRDRRAFTVAEVEAMVEAGIIRDEERFELIGGEIVPMAAKGAFHETVKHALNIFWARALPTETTLLQETTLRSSRIDFREPDFVFWPSSVRVADLQPSEFQLLVEIADSSLDYDLGDKVQYYASLAIPDYWVIDARRMITHIHREPYTAGGYGRANAHPHTDMLIPLLLPALAVRLADLGLSPAAE